ncbi:MULTISPECIES: 1-phosphofructokinase family hexose kinase [Halanaerobium]|jgi:6-phosphofructokinase 2|uniref:Tagatose-6-phosphate kinase n=1 Tax=Halanaerobium kushneri TaxID=56779 RepID=A0A1N7C1C8_9FIRM|nr:MULTISPECIES: 1-phosphofructokinase family hexose kinase [Halanaerobium]RCW52147.1 6-phosphofructokinase 2 [Halanaerobium sp. ST460_2HS_T2]SIR57264.1 6-phosphofructokinase 2 [Halanaerobium kushneri]
MKKIVTFTLNPAVDKSSSVEHVKAEDKLYCDQPIFEPGGGGINVSRAIHKLGGSSLLLYTSGGFTGKKLDKLLADENLNIRAVEIEAESRENLIINEKTSNLQYRFGMPGPEISEQEYNKIFEVMSDLDPFPDYFVISGSIPAGVSADIYAEMAAFAKKRKAKVIVDVSGPPLKSVIKEGVYLIKPNLGEFQELVGRELQDEDEIKEAALKFVEDRCCQAIVISIGAGGALLVNDQKAEFMRPPTVPIKSKVGAGDSMVAGIVLSLARGESLKESFHYGLAAGSAAVMTPGTELCTKEDTERLYQKISENN